MAEPVGARQPSATLFLGGDVMTGRGIDQVLAHPSDPRLFEPYVSSAEAYVALAEKAHGAIAPPVAYDYVWGDAIGELVDLRPDARIINLETAITKSGDAWPGKGIHYRMHPDNVACLTAAGIDCCTLANNHVLDWGHRGLAETLAVLRQAGLKTAGAGASAANAAAPARIELSSGGRVLVCACATEDCGVPPAWAAGKKQPGINLLDAPSAKQADRIAKQVESVRRPGDIVVVCIHWGGNWGYAIPAPQRAFAHQLIDAGGADLVCGHSSHHPKGMEVHRAKLILYGCGDLVNDYEGIGGHEAYRPELALLYFPTLELGSGRLMRLVLTPMRMNRFRLGRAGEADARKLLAMLNREGQALGTAFGRRADGRFELLSA